MVHGQVPGLGTGVGVGGGEPRRIRQPHPQEGACVAIMFGGCEVPTSPRFCHQ